MFSHTNISFKWEVVGAWNKVALGKKISQRDRQRDGEGTGAKERKKERKRERERERDKALVSLFKGRFLELELEHHN